MALIERADWCKANGREVHDECVCWKNWGTSDNCSFGDGSVFQNDKRGWMSVVNIYYKMLRYYEVDKTVMSCQWQNIFSWLFSTFSLNKPAKRLQCRGRGDIRELGNLTLSGHWWSYIQFWHLKTDISINCWNGLQCSIFQSCDLVSVHSLQTSSCILIHDEVRNEINITCNYADYHLDKICEISEVEFTYGMITQINTYSKLNTHTSAANYACWQ